MRTVDPLMQVELDSELTRRAKCWKVTRADGMVFAFTEHDKDIVVGGVTYKASPGFTASATRAGSDMTVDNLQVLGVIDDDDITEADLIAGKFDFASVQVIDVVWDQLTIPATKLFAGNLGEIPKGNTQFTATLAGLGDALQDLIGKVYQPTCRHDLGDAYTYAVVAGALTATSGPAGLKCAANLVSLAQTGTVTSVSDPARTFDASGLTGAGPRSVSYTANTIYFAKPNFIRDSANGFIAAGFQNLDQVTISGSLYSDGVWNIKALAVGQMTLQGANIKSESAGPTITLTTERPGYFDFGRVYWLTGQNAGLTMEIKTWDGTSALKLLFQEPYPIQVGDTFIAVPGCSKRLPACLSFGQILNRDAEDFMKGEDSALQYPNAQ